VQLNQHFFFKELKFKITTINKKTINNYLPILYKYLQKIQNLPSKFKKLVLLKSPHVNNKSMEHFINIYLNRLYIINKNNINKIEFIYKYFINELTIKTIKIIKYKIKH
jgi:ribosomal protein S10